MEPSRPIYPLSKAPHKLSAFIMFIIEALQEKHVASLHGAFDLVARERHYFSVTEAPPVGPFTEWIHTNLAAGCAMFVAVSTQGVIAWCIVRQNDQPYSRHAGCLFIGVLHQWRGRGIGRQLLRATLDKAWRTGLIRIELEVYADNEPAVQLYRSFDFMDEGIGRCAHLVEGKYRDVLSMAVIAPDVQASARRAVA